MRDPLCEPNNQDCDFNLRRRFGTSKIDLNPWYHFTTIGIKHGFSCIYIRQILREVLKTEAGGRGFQHLSRDLANVNALKNHVRSLLLHKN